MKWEWRDATLGLIVKANNTLALQATGAPKLVLPGNFATVTASSVTVTYNNTGAAVNQTIVIGSISAPITNVANNTTAIAVKDFDATILDFVNIHGDFAFKKTGADLAIAVSGASATLKAGSFEIGVTNAKLGLIIKADGGTILEASGTPKLVLQLISERSKPRALVLNTTTPQPM